MVTARDIEWAAGFLEGEGSFTVDSGKLGSFEVQASQVQIWPLLKLKEMFGGSVYPVTRCRKPGQQEYSRWRASSMRAAGIAMTVYRLMSPRRQEQILKGLASWKSIKAAAKYRQACVHGHPYSPETIKISKTGHRVCLSCCYVADYRKNRRALKPIKTLMKSRLLSMETKAALRLAEEHA